MGEAGGAAPVPPQPHPAAPAAAGPSGGAPAPPANGNAAGNGHGGGSHAQQGQQGQHAEQEGQHHGGGTPSPARLAALRAARAELYTVSDGQRYYELPGRPGVVYELRDYSGDRAAGKAAARAELPFLFKAFETGQAPPPRPGSKAAANPDRVATIHEYLDWTVTAEEPNEDEELDFSGFRVVVLLPRFRPGWPPPGAYEAEAPRGNRRLGAPRGALPTLLVGGKPICAATIRAAPGYLEVPFFATQETRRNRGYGRCLLEAIEDVARALGKPHLLLCSTDDPVVKNTWVSLGFSFTSEEELRAFGVEEGELMHMDNTVQMHKAVSPARAWRSLHLRHRAFHQRLYLPLHPRAPAAAAGHVAEVAGMPLTANGRTASEAQRQLASANPLQ